MLPTRKESLPMGKHRHPSGARRRRSAPVYNLVLPGRRMVAGALVAGAVVSGVSASSSPAPASLRSPFPIADETPGRGAVSIAQAAERLGQLAASRSAREAEQAAAVQLQAAAEASAQDAQEAAEEATRQEEAAVASQAAQGVTVTPLGGLSTLAQITNSAGPVRPIVQAAANAVVRDVPGAGGITLGGTRSNAIDPAGHPSGLALDYMVGSDSALGDAIVAYHVANWDALGVDYIIWQQRLLTSASGAWSLMEDRGSGTANHMDHPHVNYRG